MSYLASFEGKYPKNLFNKSVVASDNQTLIGHVAKETNELIVVFSESDRKVRFDIPKSEITFTGSSVVMNNNTADIQKYKVYRDTPLPQDNKSMIPTAAAQKEDVNQILSDESSSSNTKEKESSATTTTTSAAKLLLQQTSIRKEVKEEATAKIPVQTATKAKTKEAIPTTTTTTTAVPRSNYTTINKVQQEKIQQPGPIRATTTTTAQLIKEPSNATTTTTIPEDRSSLTNKKEEEKQKEAIATSKEEVIRPKVLAVPSEQATNEPSALMEAERLITKEESKISPASSSSTPSPTIPLSEATPTNVLVEEEASEKIVEEEAVETAVEKAVTKAETEEAASSTLRNMKIQQQHQEQSREQGTKEQTLSHVETEEEEAVPPNVEVTLKPPHNIEFSPPISAVNVPKALEESGTSTTERKARQDKRHFTNELFPLTTIMALWQYSIIDGIDICNEFATNVAKAAEYWFDVFWNPAARRKEERKEKVVVR
ncbi:MAG: hypothetical protein WA421_03575 [Nitrososphaeraceae archaeon]